MTFDRRPSRHSNHAAVARAVHEPSVVKTMMAALATMIVLMLLMGAPAFAAIAPGPPPAGTATVPGCNTNALEAARRKGDALVAVDKAIMDENIKQPASVLMSTCNNQAAGVSAKTGGELFSGDFMSDLQPIVGSALGSFYDDFDSSIIDFFGDIIGFSPGGVLGSLLTGVLGSTFGSGAATLEDQYDCEGIQQQWEAIATSGVNTSVPFASIANLLNGSLPSGAGEKFRKSWEASAGNNTFSNFNSAMNALPSPNVPSFASANSLCDALRAAGNSPAGCP